MWFLTAACPDLQSKNDENELHVVSVWPHELTLGEIEMVIPQAGEESHRCHLRWPGTLDTLSSLQEG